MWVFDGRGFFSAVQVKGEPDRLMVRGRFKGDLENLKRAMGLKGKILETPKADYRFRIICTKEQFGEYLKRAALDISYPNFKNEVPEKHDLYLQVWWVMRKAQQEAAGVKPVWEGQ